MDRPRQISSGDARRWNDDVNRRRLEYHERRCAEDPMYRKAYEYQQEHERKMWERMQHLNNCMKDSDKPQRIKTHEEVMRERAAMEAYQSMSGSERIAAGGNVIAMGLIAMIFADPKAMRRRIEDMKAMQPYLDEIRETDKRYRNEEICLSGFEW